MPTPARSFRPRRATSRSWPAWTTGSTSTGSRPGRGRGARHPQRGRRRPDDEIRPLAVSQRLLGTKEIIQDETGLKSRWAAESSTDLDTDIRQSVNRIEAGPYIPHTDGVRGFVFDAATGKLNEAV